MKCRPSNDILACSGDWPAFGHDSTRWGQQAKPSGLSDANFVKTLKVKWQFNSPQAGGFRASPIVFQGKVYVGNGNGRLYAIDADTGKLVWQYPPANQPLTSSFTCNPSGLGIASRRLDRAGSEGDRRRDLRLLTARSPGLGSGRLFALNAATGRRSGVARRRSAEQDLEGHAERAASSRSAFLAGRPQREGVRRHREPLRQPHPEQEGGGRRSRLGNHCGRFRLQSTNTRGRRRLERPAAGPTGEIYITTGNVRSAIPAAHPVNNALSLRASTPTRAASYGSSTPCPSTSTTIPTGPPGPSPSRRPAAPSPCPRRRTAVHTRSTPAPARRRAKHAGSSPHHVPFTPGDGPPTATTLPGPGPPGTTLHHDDGGENVVNDVNSGFGRLHGLSVCGGRAGFAGSSTSRRLIGATYQPDRPP